MDYDAALIDDIAPDVLKALDARGLFKELDDRFCPLDPARAVATCGNSFAISAELLPTLGFSDDDVEDIFAVLTSRGACCD